MEYGGLYGWRYAGSSTLKDKGVGNLSRMNNFHGSDDNRYHINSLTKISITDIL